MLHVRRDLARWRVNEVDALFETLHTPIKIDVHHPILDETDARTLEPAITPNQVTQTAFRAHHPCGIPDGPDLCAALPPAIIDGNLEVRQVNRGKGTADNRQFMGRSTKEGAQLDR